MKEENVIYDFLVQLRDGKLNKDEANDRALKYKAHLKENSDARQRKSQNTLCMQVLTLRLENDRLKEELEKVEKENERLKRDMQMLRENLAMLTEAQEERLVTVVGASVEGTAVSLLLQDDTVISIPLEVLQLTIRRSRL